MQMYAKLSACKWADESTLDANVHMQMTSSFLIAAPTCCVTHWLDSNNDRAGASLVVQVQMHGATFLISWIEGSPIVTSCFGNFWSFPLTQTDGGWILSDLIHIHFIQRKMIPLSCNISAIKTLLLHFIDVIRQSIARQPANEFLFCLAMLKNTK